MSSPRADAARTSPFGNGITEVDATLETPERSHSARFPLRHVTQSRSTNWSTKESVERSNGKVIASDPNSIKAYGSELEAVEILAPLLDSHSLWSHFKRILEYGSDPPPEDRERLDDDSKQPYSVETTSPRR